MKDKHSSSYTKGKFTILYILIFRELGNGREKCCETNGSKGCSNLMCS
jgi:hypothetical protein